MKPRWFRQELREKRYRQFVEFAERYTDELACRQRMAVIERRAMADLIDVHRASVERLVASSDSDDDFPGPRAV